METLINLAVALFVTSPVIFACILAVLPEGGE